jgi:hypothetical protein
MELATMSGFCHEKQSEVQQSIINVSKNQRQINAAKEICFLRQVSG